VRTSADAVDVVQFEYASSFAPARTVIADNKVGRKVRGVGYAGEGTWLMYTWAIVFVVFVVLCVIIGGVYGVQAHRRRKAMELRGFPIAGDPHVDPRSANEP
jgi:hypothetical protein